MTTLTCDSCDETADGVKPAMEHITANPDHTMNGAVDDEGTTVTVSAADDEDDDLWDFDE